MKHWRHLAGNIAAYLLLPIVILVGLEFLVRLTAPDDLSLRRADPRMIDRRTPTTIHVNHPGFSGLLWNRQVTIDQRGLRTSGAASGRFHILIVGDSVMFGVGVADDDSPGAVLQSMVADTVEVLNGAVIGYATDHELAYLREFGDGLDPDAVVLGYVLNDPVPFGTETVVEEHEMIDRYGRFEWLNAWLRSHSMLFLWIKDTVNAYRARYGFEAHRALFAQDSWARNQMTLMEIKRWCESREIPLVVAVFPHRDQLIEGQPTDSVPQDSIMAFGARSGIPVIDLRETLRAEDYLANDPLHLDRRGVRKAMRAIAATLDVIFGEASQRQPTSPRG